MTGITFEDLFAQINQIWLNISRSDFTVKVSVLNSNDIFYCENMTWGSALQQLVVYVVMW